MGITGEGGVIVELEKLMEKILEIEREIAMPRREA